PGDNTGKTIIVKDVKTSFTDGSKGFVPRSGKTYTLELAAGAVKTEGGQSKNLEKLTATFTGLSVEGPEIDKVRLESAERIVVEFKEEIDASNLRAAHVTVKGYEKYKSANFSEQIDL